MHAQFPYPFHKDAKQLLSEGVGTSDELDDSRGSLLVSTLPLCQKDPEVAY